MDQKVISLAAHRMLTRSLQKRGTKLIVVTPRGHLSVSLAPQGTLARARRAAEAQRLS